MPGRSWGWWGAGPRTVSQECMVWASEPGAVSRTACRLRSTQVADSGASATSACRMCARKVRAAVRSLAATASAMPEGPTAQPHDRWMNYIRPASLADFGGQGTTLAAARACESAACVRADRAMRGASTLGEAGQTPVRQQAHRVGEAQGWGGPGSCRGCKGTLMSKESLSRDVDADSTVLGRSAGIGSW